ncbi:HAD family hydrolase [Methyloraptor flagellatus]|uniref:HAD family phosphatase n=1 Tax=Methyloraptor flagellatus TaxID=3162530 RepID=A0AAU7X3R8_9HYPH
MHAPATAPSTVTRPVAEVRPDIVVFDLGNVLIRWDPRFLYRKLFADEAEMERFLAEVCHHDWNWQQDRGRTWAEAIAEAIGRHPRYEAEIRAYRDRWDEMIPGLIDGTVALLEELDARGVPLYALTNWSAETFVLAREKFGFLGRFRDIVVSGDEKLAKPEPEIYQVLIDRIGAAPERLFFIDDRPDNIEAAHRLGIAGHLFVDPERLRADLVARGLLPGCD